MEPSASRGQGARALLWLAGLALPATAGAQPTVHVRAETRIELHTASDAEAVLVEGALRDDLGAPLAGRELRLELGAAQPGGAPRRARVQAGPDGEFRLRVPAEEIGAEADLRAWFEGDRHYDRTDARTALDPARRAVRLRVELELGPDLDLDRATHAVDVAAVDGSGDPVEDLEVTLSDERGRPLAQGRTDARGRTRFVVESALLGEPGTGRWVVSSRATAARAPARTEVPIVRSRRARLAIEPPAAQGETLLLAGSLVDATGGLEGRAIGVFGRPVGAGAGAPPRHLGTAVTDGEGRFALALPPRALDPGSYEVRARFESDGAGRPSAESEVWRVEVEDERSQLPRAIWWALAALVAGALLLLRARWRPRERAPWDERVVEPVATPGVRRATPRATRPGSHTVAGAVRDVASERPVQGAAVTLACTSGRLVATSDGDGRFVLTPPSPGHWVLTVEAAGYRGVQEVIELPHRGEWEAIDVRLESHRSRALHAFRRLGLRLVGGADGWLLQTNQEIAGRAGGPVDPATHALAVRVDAAYYGPEPPTEEAVDRIATAARHLEDAVEAAEQHAARRRRPVV